MTEVTEGTTESALHHAVAPTIPSIERLVAEARRQIHELTGALTTRDRVLVHTSHELRNALAPMLLLAEQFAALVEELRGVPAARAAALSGKLHHFVSSISRVTDVADLCRGKLYLDPQALDLADLAQEVGRELAEQAAAGGAELVLAAGAPVLGSWDRVRLKQLVANLVSNAIRHAGGGRIELGVTTCCDNAEAEIVVRDHGPGIDPALLPRLFDGLEPPRGRRSGGPGIGLWVVKSLIAAMGGEVTAGNCPDGGARFCVVLPRGEIVHA